MTKFLEILKHAHSGWRYIVILLVVLAGLRLLYGLLLRKKWLAWDRRAMVFYAISLDIQTLMGGILLFTYSRWRGHLYLEHAVTMIIALVLAHVGARLAAKGSDDRGKFARAVIFLLLSSVFLAAGIWRITSQLGG